MRELRFDGLSPDGTRLILAGKDGQKWSVVIDERIEAAVRRDRARIGQVEIEQAGVLRPREIQARIRSGATAEDVAAASGLPIEHVRRFEGPVLTERAWVAQQAQTTEVRRPGSDIELGDLVAERLLAEGVDPDEISWDAWRRDDGAWVVIATFPLGPNTHVATWTYDSSSRTMTVVDDNAKALSTIDPQGPLQLAVSRPVLATVAPLVDEAPAVVTSVPGWPPSRAGRVEEQDPSDWDDTLEADESEVSDEPSSAEAEPAGPPEDAADEGATDDEAADDQAADDGYLADPEADAEEEAEAAGAVADAQAEEIEAEAESEAESQEAADEPDEPVDEEDAGPGPTSDAQDVPLFPTPPPPTGRAAGGRPSVPSFDDILFGPGPAK